MPFYEHVGGFERISHVGVAHKAEVTGVETDVEVLLMIKMPRKARGSKSKK